MERKCDFCGEEPCEVYCEDCQKNNYLCKGCYGVAHKSDLKKAHKIRTDSQVITESPCFCKDHPNEQIITFCLIENKPICLKCINSGAHDGHKFGDFKTGFSKIVDESKSLFVECKKVEFQPDKSIAILLEEDISKLKAMLSAIQKNFAAFRADLEKKEKEMTSIVELTLEERIKSRKLFDIAGSQIKTTLDEYNSMIKKGCTNGCKDCEMLIQKIKELQQIKERLLELKKMNDLVSGDYQAPSLSSLSKSLNELTVSKEMLSDKPKIPPLDTIILKNPDQIRLLRQWVFEANNANEKYELIYRATRDGMGNLQFHQKCDNKGPTVMIIQSGPGHIFGGYTVLSWDSSSGNKYNATDFIFSITHGTKHANHKDSKTRTIYCNASYGPVFGNGCDFLIWQNGDTLASGSYAFGNITFELPYGVDNNSYLAGSGKFTVTEMEVFALKP